MITVHHRLLFGNIRPTLLSVWAHQTFTDRL